MTVALMQSVKLLNGTNRVCRVSNITKSRTGLVGKIKMNSQYLPVYKQWRAKNWREVDPNLQAKPQLVTV